MNAALTPEQIELLRSFPGSWERPLHPGIEFALGDRRILGFVKWCGNEFGPGRHAAVARSIAGDTLLATVEAERERVLDSLDRFCEVAEASGGSILISALRGEIASVRDGLSSYPPPATTQEQGDE